MDIFDEEILNLWTSLQKFKVAFILIGGYAINLHGYQRFTGDMDIWIKDTLENRKALRKAFEDFGIGDYPMIETMQFIPGWTEFYMSNDLTIDILTEMKGLESYSFDECLQMASIANINSLQIPFLHINQLIENKKTVNRLKDQLDIQMLEEIKKLRNDS